MANMGALRNPEVTIAMEVGVSNNQCLININRLLETLGVNLSAPLPAIHALKGCDYNPFFFKKGKTRPYNVFIKSDKIIKCFMKLGKLPDNDFQET